MTGFYNHNGMIVYGCNWPEVPPVEASIYKDMAVMASFKRRMADLLEERHLVKVTNPERLPAINEGEFLPLEGYTVKIDSQRGYKATIV